jgi:Ca2+/Na+ antiporter
VWIHEYDATVIGAFKHLKHAFTDEKSTCVMKIHAIPEFCIDVLLKTTMFAVDVKDGDKEGRWMLCFAGAMFWLAIFSYSMLEMANMIHYNIKSVPTAFLGITVCAIGTSFPNAVASVIMAGQNKPAAAIANALGSNVQNVFLAMAMPWVIFQCFPGKDCANPDSGRMAVQYAPIGASAAGLAEGINWMIFTLLLLLVFVLLPQTCTLSKPYGIILIVTYLVYLGQCSYNTFFH